MRVHSSLQKYENEDIVMCNICFSPRIFCFLVCCEVLLLALKGVICVIKAGKYTNQRFIN